MATVTKFQGHCFIIINQSLSIKHHSAGTFCLKLIQQTIYGNSVKTMTLFCAS